jgi:hypothetical protein
MASDVLSSCYLIKLCSLYLGTVLTLLNGRSVANRLSLTSVIATVDCNQYSQGYNDAKIFCNRGRARLYIMDSLKLCAAIVPTLRS